jgi:soluble P-type ATPase
VVDGQLVRVSRLEHPRLPEPLSTAIAARYARGETVVVVERGGDVLGAIAVTSPLRPEAKPSIRRLHEMGMRTAILSGDSTPAVVTAGAELGIDDVQAALSPAGKVAALGAERCGSRSVLMVGDGVNDAPALAAASIGCAIGSGSEAALANSDVALLGSDLNGVPAAVTLARATYTVMVQNFGQAVSPARGQSLLPELPAISTTTLALGGSAEVYLNPGAPGLNDLHVFIYPPHTRTTIGAVEVTAALSDRAPQLLRHLRIASNHYVSYALLTSGKWIFHVSARVGGRIESFDVKRTIS